MKSQLIIYYYVTKSGSKVVYQPVDWIFDENMYQGYEIKSLKFSKADEAVYPPNMYCMELILNHPSYGRYAATRYVECYNFEGYGGADRDGAGNTNRSERTGNTVEPGRHRDAA